MIKKKSRAKIREKKHMRIRNRFNGTAERPRLAVFRSNKHIYAQIVDDDTATTLAAASTVEKDVKSQVKYTDNKEAAEQVGKMIAERAKAKGIEEVVFDRGGFIYHGKVQALADAAREAGLKF
ncbi:MAG: 50S ribosomal protein L18 [Lachnospiraceae bacterium]|nr:50S ribosomal protein L18 [Lachnospiraceae bacterium]